MKLRLLLFMLLFAAQQLFAQDKSEDWAQYYRYQEANKAITTPPFAVFMGDSITDIWAEQNSSFFDKYNFVGRGISGQTTFEMLARFRCDVVDLAPKVVLILAGTNDVAQNQGPISMEHAAQNIFSMCDIARANDIVPIICSVLPCADFPWNEIDGVADKIIYLNSLLEEYAERNDIYYLDYHSEMKNSENGLDPELSYDGCHPTEQGYFLMEPLAVGGIERVLSNKVLKNFYQGGDVLPFCIEF